MKFTNDPIGYAIQDFSANNELTENIIVKSDLCDDDVLPIPYLFRTYDMMPEIEQKALDLCKGTVLDVGAAAGCHTHVLLERGFDVTAIDTSKGAVDHLLSQNIKAKHISFLDCQTQFDTLLILMNGVGIAGTVNQLPAFLNQIKKLLKPNGVALCDSTGLTYLYQEDDGSMWVDLNGSYFGEMQFKMDYKGVESEWFNWLYIEFDLLKQHATEAGLNCELIAEGESNNYLVSLTHL